MTDADTARRERALTYCGPVDPGKFRYEGTDIVAAHFAGAREEAARAAAKLRAAAAETRTPFGEQLLRLAGEIEEGR